MSVDESANSRLLRFMGPEKLARLTHARVMVFGLGGVGSNCVESLVRGGVGSFVLIDGDEVELSNLNRQAIALRSTIGMRKVDATEKLVHAINPQANVATIDRFLSGEDVAPIFDEWAEKVDFVIDALDTLDVKLQIALEAQGRNIPIVSAMGAGNKLDPMRLQFADLYKTDVCPLSKAMRKRGRKLGLKHLRVIYSDEPPMEPKPADGESSGQRAVLGTTSYMPPIMGQMIASDCIRQIAGLENPNAKARGYRA